MNAFNRPASIDVPEAALSRIWQEAWHARELRTIDGLRVAVVYRGVWTYSHGPDFRDALLEIDGRLVRGAVELHLRSSDWGRHAHSADPAYDSVVLHVVLRNDLDEPVRTHSGRPVTTIDLTDFLALPLEDLLARAGLVDLGSVGATTCLPTLAGGRAELVRDALRRKGWERMAAKRLRFTQELEVRPAAEVFYRGLLDGLGLVSNRDGMAAVGEALPLNLLETAVLADGPVAAEALLLGVGGFLPLTPSDQRLAEIEPLHTREIESAWERYRSDWSLRSLAPSIWSLDRVRPANHPVRRLTSLAALVTGCTDDGLLAAFLRLADSAPSTWTDWLASVKPTIGKARIRQINTNVFGPFLAAYADATDEQQLAERAAAVWELLPGKAEDAIAHTTLRQIVGDARLPVRTALEEQGLHQIGRLGCAQLRCFECPIAELAVRHEIAQPPRGDGVSLERL